MIRNILLASIILFAGRLTAQPAAAPTGSGTLADPYHIVSAANLRWISENSGYWSKHYVQDVDIDASASSGWTGTGFSPIGNAATPFSGSYDGRGHTISGLTINNTSYHNIGLFGLFNSSYYIRNLGLINVNIKGRSKTGGLVGESRSLIENCYTTGIVSGEQSTGGLVGLCYSNVIRDCYSSAAVTCLSFSLGDTGGLIGKVDYIANALVERCYSTGSVTYTGSSGYSLGGLIGNVSDYNHTLNCYSTASVNVSASTNRFGGLLGSNNTSSEVDFCYSTGAVPSGASYVGGLIGYIFDAAVTSSYWNTVTSGQGASAGGTAKNTAEMQDQSTYSGWNFTDIWGINGSINNGYPYLKVKASVAGSGLTGAKIDPGVSVPVICLEFSGITGVPYITSIQVDRTGTATDADVPSASLYIDKNTNYVVDGSDVQLGSTTLFASGTLTFSGLNYWPSTGHNLIIVYNVSAGADLIHTAGASILSNYITGSEKTVLTFAGVTTSETPFPVELTSFAAAKVDKGIELKWTTACEVNNYGFEVERQVAPKAFGEGAVGSGQEGVGNRQNAVGNENNQKSEITNPQWIKVGFVAGAGNSNSAKEYCFVDSNPAEGKVLYRLKQINTDGSFAYYSKLAEVNYSITDVKEKQIPTEFALEQNYPNPFNPSTKIQYAVGSGSVGNKSQSSEQLVTLKVYDILGNEVATLVNEHKSAGYYEVEFNGSNLATGVYIYKLTAGSFVSTKKLMLLK